MTLDRDALAAWLEAYAEACRRNDAAGGAALFSDDAGYYPHPFHPVISGTAAIAAYWHDDPASLLGFTCSVEPLAVDGDIGVARWHAAYPAESPPREYDSVFVLRFAVDGRCREFREWFVARDSSGEAA